MKERNIKFTGVLIQDPSDGGYTAYIAELPEVIAEGATIAEANDNLFEAFNIVMDVKREDSKSQLAQTNYKVTEQELNFSMA